MAVPMLARAFALGAIVATATPAAQEPQRATCGADEQCEEAALLQSVRKVHQHKQQQSVENCTGEFKTYPYSEAILWGSNYVGWEKCDGESQSPINLKNPGVWCPKTEKGGPLRVSYTTADTGPDLKNNGHALEIGKDWGTLTTGTDTIWEAKSFHFHSPSEHTVESKAAAAEMHIVHLPPPTTNLLAANASDGGGAAAVVGIFFDVGRENSCLKQAFSELTRAPCTRPLDSFNLYECFKEQLTGDYWFYGGSLTTPPCTEGVKWHVMKKRATISKDQLHLLQSTYLNNARPVQKLNGREVGFHKVV